MGKAIGILLALVGFLMLKFFPDITDYQNGGFTKSGIVIGVVLISMGALLIVFG